MKNDLNYENHIEFSDIKNEFSFFEDEDNNFYEYLKNLKNLNENEAEIINFKRHKEVDKKISNKDKINPLNKGKNDLVELFKLKREIHNEKFLFDIKSPRLKRDNQEDSKIVIEYENDFKELQNIVKNNRNCSPDIDENKINNELIPDELIDRIKNRKEIKIIEPLEVYNREIVKREKNNIDKILENSKSKKGIVDNNVVLIRPEILPSKKQEHYNNSSNNNKINYIYLLTKGKKEEKKHDVGFQLKQFEDFIDKLEDKKLTDKFGDYYTKFNHDKELNYLAENINVSPKNEQINKNNKLQSSINKYKKKSVEEDLSTKVVKIKPMSCCQKIVNFFKSDPLKSYAMYKRLWVGKFGKLKNELQDHRTNFRGNRNK